MPAAEAVRILVVDDDPAFAGLLAEELSDRGHVTTQAGTVSAAREALSHGDVDVLVLDLQLPDGSGLDLLREVGEDGLSAEVIVLTGHADVATALEAMRLGAYDYLPKPVHTDELHLQVTRASEKARLRRENVALRVSLDHHEPVPGLITQDPVVKRLLVTLERAAASELPILILGESGTGKEIVARAVHRQSPRAVFPFVPINCAALPENIIESELFGHERGAFTGAVDRKTGLFEVASRGVIFLDEVGELAPPLQAKLLRVLEAKEFFRVGGTRVVRVDVRVVSATNKDILSEIGAGRFREDLYYRLNGVTLTLPPLRERPGDVPLLARRFLDRAGGGRMLSPAAIEALQAYAWPGNIRELETVIRRAAVLGGPTIGPEDLPLDVRLPSARAPDLRADLTLAEMERQYVEAALQRHGGHRGRTAKALGIDPKTLYNKLRAWGIA